MRILVVDDDRDTRETLGSSLRGCGFDVAIAADARAALELANAGRYDVMLADVVLGEMNGIELCAAARKACPSLRVVLMTGHEELVETVIEGGGVPLLKPFSTARLLRVLKDLERD